MGQAEFEQQLAASEKAQMMAKLNMLLTTRGESIDTIKLVAAQTELEVEVQKLKATVHRTEEQLAAAKQEVRPMTQYASTQPPLRGQWGCNLAVEAE
eukprot:COSAG03_NODE_8964_length_756_cov_1.687976_2_plen_97_part_00